MKRRALLIAGGTAALGAGVAGCAGSTPPTDWFSLVPASEALAAPPLPGEAPRTVLIGLITLPEEVDRPQLVLRGDDERPVLLEGQRWSEPLKAQLPRALALALAARWPGAVVVAAPSAAVARPDLRLSVDVQRFELRAGPAPRAILHAVWSAGGTAARREAVEVASASAAAGPLAAAMAQALQQLAGRIADGLRDGPGKAPLSPR